MELYNEPIYLKKCPFCGSKAELLHEPLKKDKRLNDTYGDFMIRCSNVRCRAFMKRRYYKKTDEYFMAAVIADRWNARQPDDYDYNPEFPDKMGGGA